MSDTTRAIKKLQSVLTFREQNILSLLGSNSFNYNYVASQLGLTTIQLQQEIEASPNLQQIIKLYLQKYIMSEDLLVSRIGQLMNSELSDIIEYNPEIGAIGLREGWEAHSYILRSIKTTNNGINVDLVNKKEQLDILKQILEVVKSNQDDPKVLASPNQTQELSSNASYEG